MKLSRGGMAWVIGVLAVSHVALLVVPRMTGSAPFVHADELALAQLTRRFEPALAPGLRAALGPGLPFYGALFALALGAALLGRWRDVPVALLTLGLSLLVAGELWLLGSSVIARAAPVAVDPALPVPEEWRAPWQPGGVYPSLHALVGGAIAGTALIAWLPLGLAALVLTLAGDTTATYFGAAHLTDVGAGFGLGLVVAGLARRAARLLLSGRLR